MGKGFNYGALGLSSLLIWFNSLLLTLLLVNLCTLPDESI
jgi:hypothetical protein